MDYQKQQLRKSFNQKSGAYHQYNKAQKKIADYLLKIAVTDVVKSTIPMDLIIDLGCGEGSISQKVNNVYQPKSYVGVDIADRSLQLISTNITRVCADIELLPFCHESANMIFSSMAFQWIENYNLVFSNAYNILKKQGILIFAMPVDGSFYSIKNICSNLFNKLPDSATIEAIIEGQNFNIIKREIKFQRLFFSNCFNAIQSMKRLGAGVNLNNKQQAFSKFKEDLKLVDQYFNNKKVPLDYKILYLVAEK